MQFRILNRGGIYFPQYRGTFGWYYIKSRPLELLPAVRTSITNRRVSTVSRAWALAVIAAYESLQTVTIIDVP